MNYWLLTTEYPPFHGGGISTYCYFTARMLAGTGHAVTVFVPDDGVAEHTIANDGSATVSDAGIKIRLVRFNSNRNQLHASLGYTARLSYAFADMVRTLVEKEGKPEVIEAQDYLGIAYYLTQFKHLGYSFMEGVPVVITLHSPAFIYLEYNRVPTFRFPDFWTGEMEKQAIRAADRLISPTRFLIGEIGRYMDLSEQQTDVLANPYSQETRDVPATGEPDGNTFTRNKIVYYGKLSPQKGSFELLTYFAGLWEEGFSHPLHIIGGEDIVYHPEMQTMGQLVHARYGSYIEKGLLLMHGKIRPDQIKESLADAQVVIVPSIVDNLPYVVMEAMSLGKVVLASVQGGQGEMIEEGISGFLFDHEDPSSFAGQLKRILALGDEEIRRIGRQAYQRVEQAYSFRVIGPQKNRILEKVVAAAAAARMGKGRFPFLHQRKHARGDVDGRQGGQEREANDLLSVVIPFYNMGAYVEEAIRSVLASTYKNLEILVIDDGSTDPESTEKLAIVGGWEKVRVVRQRNRGLALTRNAGAEMARGSYLAFLDADDKVDPSYYEKALQALQKCENVFFAGAWVQYFGNSDQLWPTFTPQPPYALVHNPVNSSGLVYKKAAFLAGGLNDQKVDYGLEDYESVINLLWHGYNGVVLPEALFHYRVRSGSMFRNVTREKLLYSNRYIAEKHAEYYAIFAVQIVNLLNANGPGYLFDNPTFAVSVRSRSAGENAFLLKVKSIVKGNPSLKKIVLTIKKFKR